MVLVDGRKYGLRAGELPGVPSDTDLADDIILTARLDGEPLLTASRDGHAQNGRVSVPLKVRCSVVDRAECRQQHICCITPPCCVCAIRMDCAARRTHVSHECDSRRHAGHFFLTTCGKWCFIMLNQAAFWHLPGACWTRSRPRGCL